MAYFGGIFFAKIWGVGVVRIIFRFTVVSNIITDRHYSECNSFQLQIHNRAARGMSFHHRDRSVGMFSEFFITDTDSPLNSNYTPARLDYIHKSVFLINDISVT